VAAGFGRNCVEFAAPSSPVSWRCPGACLRQDAGASGQLHGELTGIGKEQMMKFRSLVEPPKPMRGLEVPPEVVESLGGAKRPPVTITINGHSWKSRVAIMRGR
jgi:hypothetical protein